MAGRTGPPMEYPQSGLRGFCFMEGPMVFLQQGSNESLWLLLEIPSFLRPGTQIPPLLLQETSTSSRLLGENGKYRILWLRPLQPAQENKHRPEPWR